MRITAISLVPRQQRFGKYTRSLMKGLGVPVDNRFGLRPAMVPGTSQIAPLSINRDLDTAGWLTGVTSFNFHMHLPHYALTTEDSNAVKVLGRQPIDLSRPHPFSQAGKPRIQLVPVAATHEHAGRRHPDGRLHHLQHVVRGRREPAAVLEEYRDRRVMQRSRLWRAQLAALLVMLQSAATADAQTPLAGHYPPGQSGLRGGASPPPGWAYTNFSRLFSNLEARDASGNAIRSVGEARYANISMITWITQHRVFGMYYGALAGVPISTGNLNPSSTQTTSSSFGLGDVLITPLALYGSGAAHDVQLQLTLWSASGRFTPGATDNRGAGFSSLVYSLGGTWYPGADRNDWSLSAIARLEQNFEQTGTGIQPGHDLVIDWGVGKVIPGSSRPLELGVSGFATWQLSQQTGGPPGADLSRYRYYGAGPEASYSPWDHWTFRLRAQWEFLTRNAVQGNNLWCIVHYAG